MSPRPDAATQTSPPRASILTYLQNLRKPGNATPPLSYHATAQKTLSSEHTPLLPPSDDPNIGFWGEPLYPPEDEDSTWGLHEVLSAIAYMAVILIIVLNFDVVFSRWGFGTRIGADVQGWIAKTAMMDGTISEATAASVTEASQTLGSSHDAGKILISEAA
jgi:hypothetical protein